MSAARVERGKYKCNECKNIVGRKEIQVDHIYPVVDPIVGWVSWDNYLDRMFCEVHDLQALCVSCHKRKSKSEMELRSVARKAKKEKKDGV